MKLKTREPSKKPKSGDLPDDIDYKVWHQIFVPTFMKWVSQQDSPFEHNPKLACEMMQKIWDALFDEVPHTVVQSSPIYALVSNIISRSWRLQVIWCHRLYNEYPTLGETLSAQQQLPLCWPSAIRTQS